MAQNAPSTPEAARATFQQAAPWRATSATRMHKPTPTPLIPSKELRVINSDLRCRCGRGVARLHDDAPACGRQAGEITRNREEAQIWHKGKAR